MATLRRDGGWLILLGAVSLAAWVLAARGAGGVTATGLCAATWTLPSAASLDLLLALNPPGKLAADGMLMLAAMTPPLIVAPLRHLRDRRVARRRGLAMLAFAVGYGAVWTAAGAALQALALVLRLVAPSSMLGLTILVALLWQASPAKQYCLNRCHERPRPAPAPPMASGAAFRFGLTHGAWCVGACWPLMLPPLLVAGDHVLAMAAVTLLLFAERLEPAALPRWRLHAPGKTLWIALGRVGARAATRASLPPL
jgi:predicted metal-binding membrane protein